jgi:predicted GNAT superfamily acetyltransferase
VLVEIPGNYAEMLITAADLALEWRLASRAIFTHYLDRGYRVVDFFLASDRSRGHYLLALRE